MDPRDLSNTLDQIRRSIYDTTKDVYQEIKTLKDGLEEKLGEVQIDLQNHRKTVNNAINLLSTELFNAQKATDDFRRATEAYREAEAKAREAGQQRNDKRDKIIIGVLILLFIAVSCVALGVAYLLIGGRVWISSPWLLLLWA